MRLIDGDALMKDLVGAIASQKRWMDSAKKGNSGTLFQLAQQAYLALLECKRHLEKAPTIETPTQPQRMRGEWVDKKRIEPVWDIMGFRTWGIRYKCSICRFTHMVIEDFGQYKFCPNCGAQMDGGEQG